MDWDTDSPRPVPLPSGRVLKNGSEDAREIVGRDTRPIVLHLEPLAPIDGL